MIYNLALVKLNEKFKFSQESRIYPSCVFDQNKYDFGKHFIAAGTVRCHKLDYTKSCQYIELN